MKFQEPAGIYVNGQRVGVATQVEIYDAVAACHREDTDAEIVRDFADIMHTALAKRAWVAMTKQQREYWIELERRSQAKPVAPNRKQRRAAGRGGR